MKTVEIIKQVSKDSAPIGTILRLGDRQAASLVLMGGAKYVPKNRYKTINRKSKENRDEK